MQDTYNLGWKIASVVNGVAKRSILETYQSERRVVARDLIEFDHRFSRLFSGRPAKDAADEAGISMEEFKEAFVKGSMFASGLAVDYGSSVLVAKPRDLTDHGNEDEFDSERDSLSNVVGKQELATNIRLGMRFPSFQVLNQSDARPWHFGQFLKSDGRFRIVIFAGDLKDRTQWQRVLELGDRLALEGSLIRRFTPPPGEVDAVIEVLTIHSAPRQQIELLDLPDIFHPFDDKKGWDYDKVFVDDVSYHEGYGEAYKKYGVDRKKGCMVILRPDQHVGWIGELEDVQDMDQYFSTILIPQRPQSFDRC